MELVRTPKDMEELYELIEDMRGTQADLARVALMGFQVGHKTGWKHAHNELVEMIKLHQTGPLIQVRELDDE